MNSTTEKRSTHWRYAGAAFLMAYLGIMLLMLPTVESFVRIWSGGQTYNHGFVIMPISLWLVWKKRRELAKVIPEPVALPLVLVLLSSALWLVARLSGILIIEQIAFVGMLIGISMSLLGWRLSIFLAFPLLFLIFAVPMGEELIPPMMDFTATFTVEALRLSGIPVYREGLWFILPTGSWSVVEACSGVRYIIASVTLGFLYAYISYHSLWKRLAFIALSAAVPILANGLRAYGIVLIGHFSNMELATGADHLIYGWVFFGLVMLILFWIGGFWAEEHPPLGMAGVDKALTVHKPTRLLVLAGLGVAIVAAAGSLQAQLSTLQPLYRATLEVPQVPGWRWIPGEGVLEPEFLPTRFQLEGEFEQAEQPPVSLFVAFYPNQDQGHEAITRRNALMTSYDTGQQIYDGQTLVEEVEETSAEINEQLFKRRGRGSEAGQFLLWQWYRIGGTNLAGGHAGKLREVWARIFEGRGDGAWIAIATPILEDDKTTGRERLREFVRQVYPEIAHSMDQVLAEPR